jgi:hypothetical protein
MSTFEKSFAVAAMDFIGVMKGVCVPLCKHYVAHRFVRGCT